MTRQKGKNLSYLIINATSISLSRIIQQALYQELVFTFEVIFSESSYGFRKGRKAQQAVLKVQGYIREGYEWVVDIDLEKFFDKVNHDILMSRLARKVKDKKILLLIRRYLQEGPWRMAKSYGMHKAISNSEIESMGYIPMMTLVCGRS